MGKSAGRAETASPAAPLADLDGPYRAAAIKPPLHAAVRRLVVSADGTKVAAFVSGCGYVCGGDLWFIDGAKPPTRLPFSVATSGWLSMSPEGVRILANVEHGPAVIDTRTGIPTPLPHLPDRRREGEWMSARWLPNGEILVGRQDGADDSSGFSTPLSLAFWRKTDVDAPPSAVAADASDIELAP